MVNLDLVNTMAEKLLGSYEFQKNENFEEFLTATGVPMIPKMMMTSTKCCVQYRQISALSKISIKAEEKTLSMFNLRLGLW